MLSIRSKEVSEKIATWQNELRSMTGDETLKLLPANRPDPSLTLQEIAEVVSHVTGIEYERLASLSRKRRVVLARHLVCYFAYKRYVITWKDIGLYLGGRDHTTTLNAHRCIKNLLQAGDASTVNAASQVSKYLEEVKRRKDKLTD